jgi:thiol-disulfide isomerase/thioredoxin
MKRLLIILLVVCQSQLYAQTLNLKKNQRFSFETFSFSKYEPNLPGNLLTYKMVDFKVLKKSKDHYEMSVLESKKLYLLNGNLQDSKLPIQEQLKTFDAVAAKVLSTTPYIITTDYTNNVIAIKGLEEIRAKITAALEDLKVPDGIRPNKLLLESTFSNAAFIKRMKRFFPTVDAIALDSTYVGKGEAKTGSSTNGEPTIWVTNETLDSNITTTNMGKEKKTGLLVNSNNYQMSQSFTPATNKYSYYSNSEAVNLLSSNINELGFGNLLFQEFNRMFNYSQYYTPQQIAVRKLSGLGTKLQNEKGLLGIADEVKREVDSLDRLFNNDSLSYWAERLNLAGLIGDRSYGDIYERVPYDFITHDFHVMIKLHREYKAGNTSNFNYALELLFKKYVRISNGGYPLNMHILEDLVHNDLAKDIFKATDRETLLQKLKLIEGTEELKNPKIDRIFLALKTYTRAKLATTAEEIVPLLDVSFQGLSNRKGRYRLLIYDELSRTNSPDSIRSAYLDYSIEQFKDILSKIKDVEDRVLTRKYLADAYYRKSLLEKKEGTSYLSLAGDYLPNQQDRQDDNYTLEPENVFLPARDYNEMLLADAGSSQLTSIQKLNKMVDLLIIEPERYQQVKQDYIKANPQGNFKSFLNAALKNKLPSTPLFILKETNGTAVGNKDLKLPFTFIDFWGTWCGACIAEIHLIEALHVDNPAPKLLNVTTIACYDKKNLVEDFMTKKKYNYQVLMSDGKVEKDFKVSNYPTKILLLPNGVYVDIPSRSEYATLITKYLAWEL